ncbi:hypothetical protein C3941_19795 [Kaistia algarum]|uniref:phage tail assembly chaperone n=1 Tax=Kaistia algarum TaxID=2083279 RepID=UPI000CE77892|nr:hypothetical protein [Kaistia algarum]MCX5516235.1 hypothetical protein [Kaistia algarum]PPE78307.1 hypothetical protein C3941_19795 [Kaistia algarum]
MAEFEVGGIAYKSRKMDAFQQFHVARKLTPAVAPFMQSLAPMLAAGAGLGDDLVGAMMPLMQAIAAMPAEDCDFVIQSCLAVVDRQQSGGAGWSPVFNRDAKRMMFEDIDMPQMLAITVRVIQDNVGSFSAALRSVSSGAGR